MHIAREPQEDRGARAGAELQIHGRSNIDLLDDLDDPSGPRLDQNRAVVHDGVAVPLDTILGWHLTIDDAALRQHGPNTNILAVAIRRHTLANHVRAKARTLVHAKQTGNAACDTSSNATENAANRACGFRALSRSLCRAADDTLRLNRQR